MRRARKLYLKQCWKQYVKLSGKYASAISGQFHGHTNADVFSFLTTSSNSNTESSDYDLITVSADAPPVAVANANSILAVFTNGPSIIPVTNPALRVYDYVPSTGLLTDYTQYYSDLSIDNHSGNVSWNVEYKLGDAYNVHRWSMTDEWSNVLATLSKGGSVWKDYVKRVNVQAK